MPAVRNHRALQNRELAPQGSENNDELEIDLLALFFHLVEKAKWIIASALLATLLAGLITMFFIAPEYEATAKLYVKEAKDQVVDVSSLTTSDKLAADYVQVFRNWHVHEKVISTLNLPYSYVEIQRMLTISIPTGTRIIEITVTSDSAQEARDIAMAYAQIAPAFIEAKMETSRPNIFEEARVPTSPSSPNMMTNLIVGFILGAVVATVVFVVQFVADDRVRTAEMLEKRLGLATLGMMPIQESDAKSNKRVRKGAKA